MRVLSIGNSFSQDATWYLHGIPNAAAVRNRVNTASGREELEAILTDALKC